MTLVVVMAHGGTEEACRAHLPFWQKEGEVVFFSPADKKVRLRGYDIASFGHYGHHCPDANKRFLAMLKVCRESKADSFVVHEYDSIAFAPVGDIPPDHLAGIAYTDLLPNRPFAGSRFIHPPLYFTRAVLLRIIDVLENLRETERFMWDRWLGLCCERGNIPIHELRLLGRGYSRNTILADDLPQAIEAVKGGAVCFHGVKTKQVFEALRKAGQW